MRRTVGGETHFDEGTVARIFRSRSGAAAPLCVLGEARLGDAAPASGIGGAPVAPRQSGFFGTRALARTAV